MPSDFSSTFQLLSEKLLGQNVRCVLIGGFALTVHNVSRLTADIDFLVADDSVERVVKVLKQQGYSVRQKEANFVRLTDTSGRYADVDFINVDGNTFGKIASDGLKRKIHGVDYLFPSLKHLIALKLHAIRNNPRWRELKDLPDVVELIRRNEIDVRSGDFRQLVEKYGTKELYSRLVEFCK